MIIRCGIRGLPIRRPPQEAKRRSYEKESSVIIAHLRQQELDGGTQSDRVQAASRCRSSCALLIKRSSSVLWKGVRTSQPESLTATMSQ